MKKTLTAAALSSALVLGLASAAFAVHATDTAEQAVVAKGASKITIDGSVRERGYYNKSSVATDAPGSTGYDGRVQLGINAKVSDQATGYIQLESNDGTSDVYTWGATSVADGHLNNGGTKGPATDTGLTILQAWVNYQPGMWGVKAGHMPLALGNKMFFDHTGSGDDALVFYANPNEATHVAGLTIKFDEQSTGDNSDDLDGYVALVTHKLNDNVNLGANWTHLVGSAEDELTALGINGMAMSNIGLTADGKVGAIDYLADLEFQFGDVTDNGATTVDANGWAAKLAGNYDLGAGKIGLVYGYGSGDDNHVADNDADQFINFLTDTMYDTIIVGYRSIVPGEGNLNTGLSNLSLYQLKGSTKTTCPLTGKALSILGTLSYMNLNEEINNYGTNWEDSVGTEVDLIATWALTTGLNYKVEAAYLFVGDAYKTAATGAGSDPDDLIFLRHSLDLKF